MKWRPLKPPSTQEADLDITPFLSLMVVLIPVLLASVKFTLLAEYDIHTEPRPPVESMMATSASSEGAPLPYDLVITQDELRFSQGEKIWLTASLNDREELGAKLDETFNSVLVPAPLYVEIRASHAYQDVVHLLDKINQYEPNFTAMSVTVKEKS